MNIKSKIHFLVSLFVVGCSIAVSGIIVGTAAAQTAATIATDTNINAAAAAAINYPVAELGNCQNQDACKAYCNDATHVAACLAFAQKNNLMPPSEIAVAQKFLAAGGKGPGGCTDQESCQAYCNDMSHINECVSFAEKTGMLPPDQLAQAKEVQAAIARGVTPPPCKNKEECDAYCSQPSNMKVCVAFGEAAGFLKGNDLANAKKVIAAIDKGATPPPCNGQDACNAYCSQPDHMEACTMFALAAGLMTPQQAQDAEKTLAAIKKGVNPPACVGQDACAAYCAEPAHIDECTNFAVAAGFMTEQDAAIAKKTGGKGPGGCVGKDQCDAFCNNPDNQQTCFNFAKDNGLISPADLQKMQEGQKQFQQSLENAPAAVTDCIKAAVGNDTFQKFESGQEMPPKDIGDKMSQCFSKMVPPPGQGTGMNAGGQNGLPPFSSMPKETQDCIQSTIGESVYQQLQSGTSTGENNAGLFDKMKSCFNGSGQNQPPQNGMPYPSGTQNGAMQQGQSFQNNFQGGAAGANGGNFVGPGGCKTPQECQTFCAANPDICKNFQQPMGSQGTMIPPQPQGTLPQNQQGQEMQPGINQNPDGAMPPQNGMPYPSGTQEMQTPPPSGTPVPVSSGTQSANQ